MGSDSHTPVWAYIKELQEVTITETGQLVCRVTSWVDAPSNPVDDHGRLIAAAPCMKEALEDILLCPAILDDLNGDAETNNAVAKARAALSKAGGQSK